MQKFIYVFTGEVREHFSFLPADPPSQWLEPGDTVTCFEPLEDARFELQRPKNTPKQSSGSPAQKEA